MIYGLYLSANGMITQGMSADTIANNLANTSTHGFKRDFLALRQRDPEVLRQGGVSPLTQKHLLAIGGAVEGDRTHSIFTQGALQPTDNPLDLALNGEGFFKYLNPDGRVFYSRAGALTLDNQRYLAGPDGMRILGAEGKPLMVEEGSRYYIDKSGRLMADGEPLGQVAVVKVDDPGKLHKVGENLYESLGAVMEIPSEAQIRPGFLESSAVSPIREMTALIEAHRAYEANTNFIKIQDETLGKAITGIAI